MMKLFRWAMRVVAVICALVAMAVATAAWMHRTNGRIWNFYSPYGCSILWISPQYVDAGGWLRGAQFPDLKYKLVSGGSMNSRMEWLFRFEISQASGRIWHGFGIIRGVGVISSQVLCPTWVVIAVLLLPMGLWMIIWRRQRKRVVAGQCIGCGYDMRATPEKCPECGRAA